MEIFYATVMVCWIGVGCFFGDWPQTYTEPTCGDAEAGMYLELIEGMGQPSKWEFSCSNQAELDALRKKHGVE